MLFSEKIHNYYESSNPVFELAVEFNIEGAEGTSQATIDEFWSIMKTYIVDEQQENWQVCDILSYYAICIIV